MAAGKLLDKRDRAGAKAALGAAGECPAATYAAFLAHIIRADLAIGDGDWAGARAAFDGIGLHPEASVAAFAGFIRLRADQGLNDAAAFARDRAALVAANDSALAAAGRRIETFRAGMMTVAAYEAAVDQGQFHRTVEFIAVPDDTAAYPASILLTDDRQAALVAGDLAKGGETKPAHAWFLDLYTCDQHATLTRPAVTEMPAAYAAVKAQAVATLATLASATAPLPGTCFAAKWILPGLGRQH